MADMLHRSSGPEAPKLQTPISAYIERNDLGQGLGSPAVSQPRRSISQLSAPVLAGNAMHRQQTLSRSSLGARGGGEADDGPAPGQQDQLSVRSDSANRGEKISVPQLQIYKRASEDGPARQREGCDWQPVLAAMALSPKQQRAAVDARLALDVALAELHVRRAALYKTLCSFATTDADDGLEEAMNDTKQELMRNEEAEAEELRAFRYTFRSVLAGPLLAARSVINAVCPDASPDFLAMADAIAAELQANGGGSGSPAQAALPPMRRRSRVTVNPYAIPEGEEE